MPESIIGNESKLNELNKQRKQNKQKKQKKQNKQRKHGKQSKQIWASLKREFLYTIWQAAVCSYIWMPSTSTL